MLNLCESSAAQGVPTATIVFDRLALSVLECSSPEALDHSRGLMLQLIDQSIVNGLKGRALSGYGLPQPQLELSELG
jgi:hypothetical protein